MFFFSVLDLFWSYCDQSQAVDEDQVVVVGMNPYVKRQKKKKKPDGWLWKHKTNVVASITVPDRVVFFFRNGTYVNYYVPTRKLESMAQPLAGHPFYAMVDVETRREVGTLFCKSPRDNRCLPFGEVMTIISDIHGDWQWSFVLTMSYL